MRVNKNVAGKMRPWPAALALSCLLTISVDAAADGKCSKPPFDASRTNGVVTIHVDWENLVFCTESEKHKSLGARIGLRVHDDNPVNIHITNFNFVNYTVSYTVEETVVETYVLLEKLWAQLLGIPIFGEPTIVGSALRTHAIPTCTTFKQCGANWAFKIATTQIVLNEYLQNSAGKTHTNVATRTLIKAQSAALKEHRVDIERMLKVIVDDPGNAPKTIPEVTQFDAVFAKQEKLFEKLDAYHAAAELVASGKSYMVGKKKTGTIVSVSLTPKDHNQADSKPATTTEYFVHSKLPVVFHAGYSFSKLKDAEFETVRSLEQTDLFSEVKNESATLNTMVAFLSLGRSFFTDETLGAFLSIGTDFSSPGDRLYIGASVQIYKRFFVTVGRLNAAVTEGVNPVLERVGNATNSRELYTAIATRRDWDRAFYSISFRVF